MRRMNLCEGRAAVLTATLAGVLITFCLMFVAFVYSVHDGFRIAGYLFPYAVLRSPTPGAVGVLSILLAAAQFPLYGFLVGLWWRNRTLLAFCCVLLVSAHCAASVAAERAVENLPVMMKF